MWEDISWRQPANLLSAVRPMADSMWEDMSDGSQRIFCQLLDSWLTQCGKTGVATAGQFIKARDMCRFCPTVGRSATGRVKIFDHPDSLKNVHGCLCSVVRSVCCNDIFLSKLVIHSSSSTKHICKSRHVHNASSLGHLSLL